MKLIIIIVVLLVIVLVYLLYPVAKAISISQTVQENAKAYEQHPTNPTMRILVAGDSTGVGTGARSPQDSIAGRIGSDFPGAHISNISENGITLEVLRNKLYSLPKTEYNLIVIQIGSNDVTSFTSKQKVAEELKLVLDYAEEHSEKVIVLTAGNIGLSPVFKFPLSNLITYRTLMVREIFMKEVGERSSVYYVDLFESADDDMFSTDIEKYYAPDYFHPSSEGYGVWYHSVKNFLN